MTRGVSAPHRHAPRLIALIAVGSGLLTGLAGHSAQAKNACVLGRTLQQGLTAAEASRGFLPARFYVECGQPVPAEALAADPTLAG
jgi:hypothetical protein